MASANQFVPKRIAIAINASWNIANFRMGLVRRLQQEGHQVIALAPEDRWSERLMAAGLEFHPISMDRKGLSPLADGMLFLRYVFALRRIRADLFLGYTAKPNVYGSMAAHLLGIPVINNVSGLGTAFIRGGLLSHVLAHLYRVAFRRSATVFFQNDDDLALFTARGLVQPRQARLLPGSGVDLAHFRPADPRSTAGEGFRFLLVARLLWDKGVGEYVEATRRVRASHPEARFQLLGHLDLENRTAVTADQLDAWVGEGLIDYLGEAEDVRPFIADADCVVLPSYREGLPRTLLEAGAMAKPLIASDVPGCRHVVTHRTNGLLCEVRDAGSLADAMLEMIRASQAVRDTWGKAGREKIEREFDERMVTQSYLEAIADAFARTSTGSQMLRSPG